VQGIVDQPGRVVALLIPTRQADDALAQQVADRVPNLVGIPAIGQARRQAVRQLEAGIPRPIESSLRRRLGRAFEGQLRDTRCGHWGSCVLRVETSEHRSSRTGWSLDGLFSRQSCELFRLGGAHGYVLKNIDSIPLRKNVFWHWWRRRIEQWSGGCGVT